jgi:AefR-like transcriptional repressor, C-terminal domain
MYRLAQPSRIASRVFARTLLHWGFDSDRIALMRLAIAEARRFPNLASTVSRQARERSTELGVHLLEQLAQSDELSSLPAFAPERRWRSVYSARHQLRRAR